MVTKILALFCLVLAAFTAFAQTTSVTDAIPPIAPAPFTVDLDEVQSGITSPVFGTATPALLNHLFIVDQAGTLWRMDTTDNTRISYLDVSSLLIPLGIPNLGNSDERGFLGLAFHPDFASNGLFYTYTSEPVDGVADFTFPKVGTDCPQPPESLDPDHQNVVREWHVSDPTNPDSRPDADSRVVLRIDWPNFNHNGGTVLFGPDGMLYLGLGDGGGEDDQTCQINLDQKTTIGHAPGGNGQDPNVYGSMLRIDVNGRNSANGQYGIPPDNPFIGNPVWPAETYAYGLRNPYRFAFDPNDGTLYLSDAGNNDVEESDIIRAGGNYGWAIKEGTFLFDPAGFVLDEETDGTVTANSPLSPLGLMDPFAEYAHDVDEVPQAVVTIGGWVYDGTAIPELQGRYIFGDYSADESSPEGLVLTTRKLRGDHVHQLLHKRGGPTNTLPVLSLHDALDVFLLGFARDNNGELYVLGNTTGTPFGDTGVVRRLVSSQR